MHRCDRCSQHVPDLCHKHQNWLVPADVNAAGETEGESTEFSIQLRERNEM